MDQLGFKIRLSEVKGGVFIPKYYDPGITESLALFRKSCDLISIRDLVADGTISISSGHEIGKMAYGTGTIPFIRTSDISNLEIKSDPKHGVSEEIYAEYSTRQDVAAGDIFLVKDGTYLIGQSCIVTKHDLPCLYQSHILKLRTNSKNLNEFLLLALLNLPIVKEQIRSMQFTADIIDTIGNRIMDIILPIPKDNEAKEKLSRQVKNHIEKRVELKETLEELPLFAEAGMMSLPQGEVIFEPKISTFTKVSLSKLKDGIFIPKYYDPLLRADMRSLASSHEWVPLSQLVEEGAMEWTTGIEIGKMAYGTGTIPFIRTSDISNWELKADPKQGISEEIYLENRQDIAPEDIFIVRDGTYLVGTSCILMEHDTKIIYCGGIYKLRILKKDVLDPYLLMILLNAPLVRRQMRAVQFTRDVIDTLGKRLFEIRLPIPKDKKFCKSLSEAGRYAITTRSALRDETKNLIKDFG